ncbi:MAG: hypothetical protein EKK46_03780 [Rhodocyclaceae bacterium]|nr:MAG: hypothetical protein EKK46_03780 [Rhodocyclaceae bacterium]
MNANLRVIFYFLISLLLASCGGGEPEDVRLWMTESTKDMRGKVPPLPEIKAMPVITYEPGELIPPFNTEKLFAEEAKSAQIARNGGPKPLNPDAYPMTRVPLEAIRLVGTMLIGKEVTAIMTIDREAPRRVRVGDYVGQNFGRVTSIKLASDLNDGEVTVKETVLEKGVWVEKESRVAMPSQGDKK